MPDTPERLDHLRSALADRYRIERELGRGGMATVYLAEDLKHRRQVAIKVLRPELAAAVGPERFLREIEIAAKLSHPHILPLHDSGEADGFLYYVMPYVKGESLGKRLDRDKRLDIEEAVEITRAVAAALDKAHRQGIVHRDIKPANILLQDEEAVVADFGIALAVSAAGEGRVTVTGTAVGTPEYMSPEQASGETKLDGRSDIYSLGCVLYEMLTGRPPFSESTASAVLAAQVTREPKQVAEVRPEVPSWLNAVIARALAKAPGERFPTAAEFRRALSTGTGVAVRLTSPRRNRLVAVGLMGAALLVVLIVVWLLPSRVEGDPRKGLIVFPFENRTGDPDNDWLQEAAMHGLGLTLAHWDELRVFDDERTASLMRRRGVEDARALDFDLARRMAREAQVGTLVLGDIRREGRLLAIEAKVHDVRSGERLATEIVRGQRGSDPRFLFDSLAARILRVSGAPPGERPGVVAQTTHSLEAYRAYLAGTDALHQFALDSAEACLRRAVELDSAFALAYLQLRNVYGWRGAGDEERRAFISQAETYGQTLPPRLKMLLEYYVAYENGHLREARSIAERLIARDSGDVEAWYQLGEAHLHHASGFAEPAPIPHADSLGNIGKALHAFERALELDSSYILAYRHIVDALEACSRWTVPWICVGDSAVYGDTDKVRTELGAGTVERLRDEAGDDLVATAYRWVAAAPRTELPRERIVQVLLGQQRLEEAERQLSALANLASGLRVAAYEVLISLANHDFREAGERASEVVQAISGPQELGVALAWNYFDDAFLSAGRVQEFEDLVRETLATMPGDDALLGLPPPANQIRVPKRIWRKLQGLDAVPLLFARPDSAALSRAARELLDVGETALAGDSLARILLTERNRDLFLFLYLASRDSTILSRLLPYVRPDEFPAARAHLALARSDTTGARGLLGHYRPARTRPADFTTEREFLDAFSWATVLAELGDLRSAVAAYARLDSTPFSATTFPVLPLTWAERGALRQQLGDSSEAIELYERFIDAWRDADEALQWQVEQAEATVAALRGTPYPMTER